MVAATFHGPREIVIAELPDPVPGPGEAVVRVRAAGVCGGDLHEYRAGRRLYATPYPRPAQGHELAGDVVGLGEGVTRVRLGDRVAVQPMVSCDACSECDAGRYALCQRLEHIGVARPGGFAELCVAPAENLFPLPSSLEYEEGALLDCTAVAVHALHRVSVSPRDDVVVLGAGAIGLAVAQLARATGAGVILVGTRRRPLEIARALGVPDTVDLGAGEGPPVGARVVFETAGGPDPLERALAAAAPGASIGLVGETFEPQTFDAATAMARELTIAFVWSHDGRREYELALEAASSGAVRLAPAVTHRYPLHDLSQAFEAASDRARTGAVKVIVTP